MGEVLSDTARNRTVLVSAESAREFLRWFHQQSVPGSLVTRFASLIQQLETFEPRSTSSSSSTPGG